MALAVRRTAGYVCKITVGAGTSAKMGFHGAALTVQRTGVNPAAVTYTSQTVSNSRSKGHGSALE